MKLEAVYFVPRGEILKPRAISGIMWALSRCQTFYLKEARVLLNWSLAPSPVLGAHTQEHYKASWELLLEEAMQSASPEAQVVGMFYEGDLPRSAFGGGNGERGYFVIARPYVGQLEYKVGDSVVAHEIGHALGLPDSKDNFSIMGAGWQWGGLRRTVIFPRHRAHLKREDREKLGGIEARRWT